MPTYQYACTSPDCGNRFDLVQSFTDPAASACPVCGQPVRKVYGSVGVVFKGSGFYRNDSRAASASATAAKSESNSDKSPKATKSESNSDKSPTADAKKSEPAKAASGSGSAPSAKAAASA